MEDTKTQTVFALIEQWTRAEIIARHVPFNELKCNSEYQSYCHLHIQLEDKIRQVLFGTDDLVELGIRWGILKDPEKIQLEEEIRQNEQVEAELAKIEAELSL